MLCSNCSHEVKPVVAVDVDGTIGDYHGHFLQFTETYLQRSILPGFHYKGDRKFSDWVCSAFHIHISEYRAIKLAYRQGAQKRSMPIMEGARELCHSIVGSGAELWITTTRPYLSLDTVVPDTMFWLKNHDIGYHAMLFDEDKYKVLSERVDRARVVAVLDDLPEMLNAAALYLGREVPILVLGQYNALVRSPIMADLGSAQEIVLQRIHTWKERYA